MAEARKSTNATLIKKIAAEHGFDFCGISKAEFLEDEAAQLAQWLKNGYQGKMGYMTNHFDKRLDPRKLVPGAKSVVSLAYNYYSEHQLPTDSFKISKYAYGQDYHFVIKSKLRDMLQAIQQHIGEVEGRIFVDSAPVMERSWAKRSGIGWIGKHTLLLNRQMGSFFFLAEWITDLPLEPDGPMQDYCGSCTRCMEACPTDAIVAPYQLDASKCISYLTIELKEEIPKEFQGKMENWIFGCDICQDVCPWNRFSKPHSEPQFEPGLWKNFETEDWVEMTEEVFQKVFNKSPVKRAKYNGLKKNISFVLNQK